MRRDTYQYLQRKVPLLSSLFSFLCERPINISEIPPGSDSIGYTRQGKTIFVSYKNEFTEPLSRENALSFCSGVSVHEFAHQYFTNFDEHKRRIQARPSEERSVYGEIANIVEDARIENFVPGIVSKAVAKTLEYSIATIYKKSPNIEQAQSPYAQFGCALIQLGDEGILKGHFTFDEAFEAFKKIAPLFNKAATEPDGKKVFDIIDEIFEISRPLWEDDVKAQKELAKILSDMMKEDADGEGEGREAPSWGGNKSKSERREMTSKKVLEMPKPSKEKSDNDKETGSGSGSGSEDSESEKSSESGSGEKGEKNDKNSDEKNSGGSSSDKDGDKKDGDENDSSQGNSSQGESSQDDSSKSPSNNSPSGSNKMSGSFSSSESGSDQQKPENSNQSPEKITQITPEDMQLSDEEAEELERLLNNAEKPEEKPEEIDELDPNKLTSIGTTPKIRNIKAPLKPEYAEEYKKAASSMRAKIAVVSKELQRIFDEDKDKKIYRATGRISMKRVAEQKQTPNLFTKRRLPGDKKDIAIAIAVDNSGSMQGPKIKEAKKLCVAFAEIFGKLEVPLYIMGFTTGGEGLVHEHYVQWKNSPTYRPGLCDIDAHECNGDSVAVRYLKGLLEKRPESRKLLIVISDGMPSASFYGGMQNALEDTVKAVKETQASMNVLGVAIGLQNNDKAAFKKMYGNDYIFLQKAEQLFGTLTRKVKTIMNK